MFVKSVLVRPAPLEKLCSFRVAVRDNHCSYSVIVRPVPPDLIGHEPFSFSTFARSLTERDADEPPLPCFIFAPALRVPFASHLALPLVDRQRKCGSKLQPACGTKSGGWLFSASGPSRRSASVRFFAVTFTFAILYFLFTAKITFGGTPPGLRSPALRFVADAAG